MSDGWGGIDDAMLAVYGQVPEYSGRGRPPTRKQPQPGSLYLQMVKHRDDRGQLMNTELRVIFGQPEEVPALFGKSTAYIERTHLTMRLFNGRLVRHTLGFSKDLDLYRVSAAWEASTTTWSVPSKPYGQGYKQNDLYGLPVEDILYWEGRSASGISDLAGM